MKARELIPTPISHVQADTGWWEEDTLCPCSLSSTMGRRVGSRVMRLGELVLPLTVCSTQGIVGPTPYLGSILELILLAGVQMNQFCGHESRSVAPSPSLIGHGVAWVGKICPPCKHHPLPPAAVRTMWMMQNIILLSRDIRSKSEASQPQSTLEFCFRFSSWTWNMWILHIRGNSFKRWIVITIILNHNLTTSPH